MKKSKKLSALLLAALMAATLLAACSSDPGTATPDDPGASQDNQDNNDDSQGESNAPEGVKTGGTMVMGQGAEPLSLNPNGKPDDNMPNVAQNIWQRLVKTNNNQEIIGRHDSRLPAEQPQRRLPGRAGLQRHLHPAPPRL